MAFDPDPSRPFALLAHCPAYAPSPLRNVAVAGRNVWVKDETARMGLGAFKALGGVYAVAALLGDAWVEAHGSPLAPQDYLSDDMRAFAGRHSFVCASAGNHGMAVAAGARVFGAQARIFLSETVPESFAARLAAKGAEVKRAGQVYDESIAAAIEDAEASGAIHLADGSWPGYTRPPSLVMEGYAVMAEEMRQHFDADGAWPTQVFLQAGVGGLAAAIAVMIRRNWAVQPEIVVVEPDAAPCLAASHDARRIRPVEGPVSSMGRLDCKVASLLAFKALEAAQVRYVTVTDTEAEAAAAGLAAAGMPTTPSGAAGLAALLAEPFSSPERPPQRPLIIVSEGPA